MGLTRDWPGKLGFSCPNLTLGSNVGVNRIGAEAPLEGPVGQALRGLRLGLRPQGRVGISVPSFPS